MICKIDTIWNYKETNEHCILCNTISLCVSYSITFAEVPSQRPLDTPNLNTKFDASLNRTDGNFNNLLEIWYRERDTLPGSLFPFRWYSSATKQGYNVFLSELSVRIVKFGTICFVGHFLNRRLHWWCQNLARILQQLNVIVHFTWEICCLKGYYRTHLAKNRFSQQPMRIQTSYYLKCHHIKLVKLSRNDTNWMAESCAWFCSWKVFRIYGQNYVSHFFVITCVGASFT